MALMVLARFQAQSVTLTAFDQMVLKAIVTVQVPQHLWMGIWTSATMALHLKMEVILVGLLKMGVKTTDLDSQQDWQILTSMRVVVTTWFYSKRMSRTLTGCTALTISLMVPFLRTDSNLSLNLSTICNISSLVLHALLFFIYFIYFSKFDLLPEHINEN